jgi:hypothetical protein
MNKLILPKTYVQGLKAPLIFLAGPIRSGPNWQDEAIEFLFSQESDLIVASPRRDSRVKFAQYILNGDENYFPRQRAWERHYLGVASRTGAILFWLSGETEHDCKKVFGEMTSVELGQWMVHYNYDRDVRFCFGSNGEFPELDTIEDDLKKYASDKITINTLEETCREAIRLAYQR